MLRLIYCGQFRNVQIILFLFSLLSDCSEFFLYTSIYWIVLTATQKYSLLYWYMKQFSEKVRFSQFIIFLTKLLFTFFQIMFILSRLVSTAFFFKVFYVSRNMLFSRFGRVLLLPICVIFFVSLIRRVNVFLTSKDQ